MSDTMNLRDREAMSRDAWRLRLVLQADLAMHGCWDGQEDVDEADADLDWEAMTAVETATEAGVARYADVYHDGDVDAAYDDIAGLAWEVDRGCRQ